MRNEIRSDMDIRVEKFGEPYPLSKTICKKCKKPFDEHIGANGIDKDKCPEAPEPTEDMK